MADSKKYDGSQWEHSLRKMTTASEIIVPPTTIYADGSNITTYTIKGNTVQNGTPSPSNPVSVNGVGERTENLLDYSTFANDYWVDINSGLPVPYGGSGGRRTATLTPIDVSALSEVTFDYSYLVSNTLFIYSLFNGNTLVTRVAGNRENSVIDVTGGDKLYLCFYSSRSLDITISDVSNAMLNTGSTAKPYEPYGFKIPIPSGGVTTNVYLNEPLHKISNYADSLDSTSITYSIKKWVWDGTENWRFDTTPYILRSGMDSPNIAYSPLLCTHFTNNTSGITNGNAYSFQIQGYLSVCSDLASWKQWLADQYTAGTPVTVWYVLATSATETVTAPSIPTTDGANSITVDTTVQPSEFTATWTGWHDADVKEKSENLAPPLSEWIDGYINTEGGVSPAGSTNAEKASPYIDIGDITTITYSRDDPNGRFPEGSANYAWRAIGCYAADKSFLSRIGGSGRHPIITTGENALPIGTKYIRLTLRTYGEPNEIMCNEGSTMLPYEPYWK